MRVVKIAAWQEFGYTPASRVFLMWGHSHLLGTGARGTVNHLKRTVADRLLGYRRVDAYRLSPAICAEYAEALIAFRPLALISYASALDLFARNRRIMPANIDDNKTMVDARHAKLFFKLALVFLREHDLLRPRQVDAIFALAFLPCPFIITSRFLNPLDHQEYPEQC